jgi:tetratricopeptide (TPR) repeat protein
MPRSAELARIWLISWLALTLVGCSELRARQLGREGNRHFKEGDYRAAVRSYEASEQRYPLPVVALNKGLACRQLLLPGAKSPENERAVECALAAFKNLKNLSPSDARADQLYLQTLFDADRFDQLARIFEADLAKSPNDPAAINGLVQVYSRWGRWDEALRWTIERAKRRPNDAEAHYAVGVFIYNRLFEKGGGPDKSGFDPRPTAEPKPSPAFGPGDIVGAERTRLADEGIAHLEKALQLRANYADAMTYLGLLYRQKSFAYFAQPDQWQAAVDAAEARRREATALHTQNQPKRQ